MNSAEQKDYEHAAPSDKEIQETIAFIREKLDNDSVIVKNQAINVDYRAAIDILEDRITNIEQIPMNVSGVKTRVIAILAVNYLNGECSREVLVGGL